MTGRNAARAQQLFALLSDESQGGAAVSANRLAAGLAQIGARVERWYCSPETLPDFPAPQVSLERRATRPWPERLLSNFSRRLGRQMRTRRQERLLYAEVTARQPSLLHVHNLHASGLTHTSLLGLPPDLPLVWTLHDCATVLPFCYEWNGPNGREVLGADRAGEADDRAARGRFFATRPRTVLVSPSRWLQDIGRAAVPVNVRVERIPYGIPTDRFRPLPAAEARQDLNLPQNVKLVGFAAAALDTRKGADIFAQALAEANLPGCEGVIWGDDSQTNWPAEIRMHRFGRVHDEQQIVRLYSACDLFVCPSRIDNLPNTVLESIACGTPVVGSAVGGIPDLVRPNQTGWLYERNDPQTCAQTLREAFQEQTTWPAYRERSRNIVLTEFTLEIQARAYLRLYDELVRKA
jgi:glycosyltransferase involved in cell wall biosynthesis